MSTVEIDIMYFKEYKNSLERFIYVESGILTIKEYMSLVLEIERIKAYIEILKKSVIKIDKKEFSIY